jgi:hypothetical protein
VTGDLPRAAQEVLEHNRRGSWTCPATGIYPHQWLWDSCFIAIGLARTDPQRAADEVRSVLRGQWTNGMVPHMIFAPEVRDLGSTRLWQSRRDSRAPRDVDTSCITQPPLLAVAAWYVARHLGADDRREFVAEVVPRIARYHRWLYRDRDPDHNGLVTLIHPWECGLDTTPPWMDALRSLHQPAWLRLALKLRLTRFVRFLRRDTRYVPSAERASDDNGLRMLALARRARRFDFDLRRLPTGKSLLVHDLGFNALLVVANRLLSELATDAGAPLEAELVEAFDRTVAALEELWDDEQSCYCSRDASNGDLLRAPTVATFFALWANLHSDRMERLIARLTADVWSPNFPVPSVPTDSPQFDPERYWQGPTWINTNWIVIRGLRAQDEHTLADELQRLTVQLVDGGGFAEYFSPYTGEGYGAREFSWTAALALELLAPRSSGE